MLNRGIRFWVLSIGMCLIFAVVAKAEDGSCQASASCGGVTANCSAASYNDSSSNYYDSASCGDYGTQYRYCRRVRHFDNGQVQFVETNFVCCAKDGSLLATPTETEARQSCQSFK